jgi:hypothetical protein
MTRIQPISYEQSTGKAKELLDTVKAKLGITPNMMKTMAQSPAVLEAYLNFSSALGGGKLSARFGSHGYRQNGRSRRRRDFSGAERGFDGR